MSATIVRPGPITTTVKNLGWLLRNWQDVNHFVFHYCPDNKTMVDGYLYAELKSKGIYRTEFASLSVLWNWLDRPIFRGLTLFIYENKTGNTKYVIGDKQYKNINKLDYKKFMETIVGKD